MVLHSHIDDAPWLDPRQRRLPGTVPADPDSWLAVDDRYAAQMAERERLIADRPDAVIGALPHASEAVVELVESGLAWAVAHGFAFAAGQVTCPDGRVVGLEASPLELLGRLFQQDLCLMQKSGDEHRLTAAVLCFPASWTLSEKLGRGLGRIHKPVTEYEADIARRVERLFDGVRAGRPLMRSNVLGYDDPALFHPRPEGSPHRAVRGQAPYVRTERQVIFRLPRTNAVGFSIHTRVVRRADLTPEQLAALPD